MNSNHTGSIHNVLNKNQKQLLNQIDGFSINLHQHQQQLKSIITSINELVTFLQNHLNSLSNNNPNKTAADELSQFSNSLHKKLELIAQCIRNIDADQLQPLKDEILNALRDTNNLISNKIDEKHKSFSIMNASVSSIQKIIQNNRNNINISSDLLKQINIKLSNIDLQIKRVQQDRDQDQGKSDDNDKPENLHFILSNYEETILNKIANINIEIKGKLSEICEKLSKISNDEQNNKTQLQSNKTAYSVKQSANNLPLQSDLLSTNIFFNRINAMEQRFESRLLKMSEQQTDFQKCVLEQLNQLQMMSSTKCTDVAASTKLHSQNVYNGQRSSNNMSLWMTVQEIDHNTKELNLKMQLLKEQQIAQFETITNLFCRQKESSSVTINEYQSNSNNLPSKVSITRKYMDDRATITDCDDLVTWNKMDGTEKQYYCNALMKRLFPNELYQHTVEPKNSFYLQFAKTIIEDWKAKNKWNHENWESMDEKKLLISKMWSYLLMNWNECIQQS